MPGVKVKRSTPELRERLKKLASRATHQQLGDRFGLSERQVRRILEDCPDCDICGSPAPLGNTTCQRCLENEISETIGRKGHL